MKLSVSTLLLLMVPVSVNADWQSDADARIERLRKGDFVVSVRDASGAAVAIRQAAFQLKKHEFLFGTAIAYAPFADQGEDGRQYRKFILEHFSGVVCENEMKWYDNEAERGHVDYSRGDALLAFAEQNGLVMRGHNLFWEKEKYAMPWLAALDPAALRTAVDRRLTDTVTRYRGRVVCWDVDNEVLDGNFFRSRLGADILPQMFKTAARLDPDARLFVNEYAILGNPEKAERLITLVKELRASGAPVGGIGIQSHDTDRLTDDPGAAPPSGERPEWMMKTALTPEMFLGTLDRLQAETGLPVHLTEISARTPDAELRGRKLEMLFRLGFSHESVRAILLWGFGAKTHWMGPDAALVNADNTLNAAGRRISHLLRDEWTTRGATPASPDGAIRFRGFFGKYSVALTLADGRVIEREVSLLAGARSAVVTP